jgi:hypothetical protein
MAVISVVASVAWTVSVVYLGPILYIDLNISVLGYY